MCQNTDATELFFFYFTMTFDFIHWRNTEKIIRPYVSLKETVTVAVMLYIFLKGMIRTLCGTIPYLDIVAGGLQRDTLATYQFIIYINYLPRTAINMRKVNGSLLKKVKSIWYHVETITEEGNVDDSTFSKYTASSKIWISNRKHWGLRKLV